MKRYVFFSDPGHGWLQVTRADLKELDIEDKISSCSYQKGEYVYLEEDCDAGVFFQALKKLVGNAFGQELKFQDILCQEVIGDQESFIRKFRPYQKGA